jgi:iron complex transport system substrate-binding protein
LVLQLLLSGSAHAEEAVLRVVSLNPSLTATVLALGEGDLLVGVDDWSARTSPEVTALPRVGGLFNPSLEAIVALEPDLVVLVPSAQQRDLRGRLEALGVDVLALANESFDELLSSIEQLGARIGRGKEAELRVDSIRSAFAPTKSSASPRAVLIIQRDPLYVVGGGSYLDRMLSASGLQNVAGELSDPYPRVGVEWLIAAAPEVILDASENVGPALAHWSRWPSLPAVAKGRVVEIEATLMTMPGPDIDRALTRMRAALAESNTQ